jgi:hypothetical protein
MKYWAVNTVPFSDVIPDSVDLGKFRRPRSPNILKGDKIVLFIRTKDTIKFLASAEVSAVIERPTDSADHEDEDRAAIEYTADIIKVDRLATPPSLDDYRFSLTKVYRLSKPKMHFRRRYVNISEVDFETLVSMQINATRTSVGILAEALPLSDRLTLSNEFIGIWQDKFKEASHNNLLSDLLSYVRKNYIELASLLTDMARETLPLRDKKIIEGVEADTMDGKSLNLLSLADSAETVHRGFVSIGESPFEALAHQDDDALKKIDYAFQLSVTEVFRIFQVI